MNSLIMDPDWSIARSPLIHDGDKTKTHATRRGRPFTCLLRSWASAGPCRVRDLWERRDVGIVEGELAPVVAWHGAVLYRPSPEP